MLDIFCFDDMMIDIKTQKIHGLYGRKHHKVEKSEDVGRQPRSNKRR